MSVIVLLMITGYFFVRPGAMGQEHTIIGLLVSLLAVSIYLIFYLKNAKFEVKDKNKTIFFWCFIFWGYLLLHAWLNESDGIVIVFKAFLNNMFIITIYFILLNNKTINYKFFRGIFIVIKISILSWIITLVISFIVPFDNLFMFRLPLESYETSGNVYFPTTILYGFMTVDGIKLPRLLSLYRESGISQMIFIWYYFMLKPYNLDTKINKFVLIIGVIATFSTSGIFILIFLIGLRYLIEKNNMKNYIISIIMAGLSFYILFNAPYIGIKNKLLTHGESISIRLDMTLRGIQKFFNNPFGIGLYGDMSTTNGNINLICSLYTIGLIGFILYIGIYIIPILKINRKSRTLYIVSVASILITSMLSQPLIDAPGVYIHLFACYSILKGGRNENYDIR